MGRYVSIWFPHLMTDWFSLRQPQLKNVPFVLRTAERGRMVITSTNAQAVSNGLHEGMTLADAKAFVPDLEILDDKPELPEKLLKRLAEWCIRFTPVVGVDLPDGLLLDATGCAHLWGGEDAYLQDIVRKLQGRGYSIRAAIGDTIGVAWAVARFGDSPCIISSGRHIEALLSFPPEALRLDIEITERLHKLGLHQIETFISIPRPSLRKRFGVSLLHQLDKAMGLEIETIVPVVPIEPFQERLPCLEPIVNLKGIEIATQQLLEALCFKLKSSYKGLRSATLKCFRIDGKMMQVVVGTNRPTHHVDHLFKLFELKLSEIEPGLGIELFTLEAPTVEDIEDQQEKIWGESTGLEDVRLAELLDRLANKLGSNCVHRYLPDEHYWPERSFKASVSLQEKATTSWRVDTLRPVLLLQKPEHIEVTAPIPDYPPMLFRYKGKLHKIIKADGPERIEQEWWIQQGQHRDYYQVEDEEGNRYWIFRLGHYHEKKYQWFIHGYFA